MICDPEAPGIDWKEVVACGCRLVLYKQPPRPYVIMRVWFPPSVTPVEMVKEVPADIDEAAWFDTAIAQFIRMYTDMSMQQKQAYIQRGERLQ